MTATKSNTDLIEKLGSLALATRLKRLSDALMADVAKLYREHHLKFEPRWFALLFLLHQNDKISIVHASKHLGFTHPALIQLVEQMEKAKLIKTQQSKADGRVRIISLTVKGRKTFNSIQPLLSAIQKANDELIHQSGSTFLRQLENFENQHRKKNIYERAKSVLYENTNGVKILTYEKKFAKDFKRLNLEWIEKYFKPEKQDLLILNHPEKEIIEHEGAVFFAKLDDNIVGTVAMIKHNSTGYELAKMGVTEKYRGRKIGNHLIEAAINFAKEKNVDSIILDTNSSLKPAIALYKKYGFRPYRKKEKEVYQRSDVHLRLKLKTF